MPSDGADRSLDTDGTIAASVSNFQTWLKSQAGGRALRIDTFGGQLDVSFQTLPQTNAQLAANGLFIRDAIERLLKAAGFTAPGKIYAVYYDGSSTAACGGGAWPPLLPGNVGAVYTRATFGAGSLCYDPPLSRSRLQIMDFAVLHEVLHTMGFVPTCAEHHTRAGHVSDNPSDLMWAGEGSWTPSVLDVGHDDYFQTGASACPDLAQSAYLEENPWIMPLPQQTPPPTTPPLSLSVTALTTVPPVPRAGRVFTARLAVARSDDGDLAEGKTICRARVRGRALPVRSAGLGSNGFVCSWKLPAGSRGAALTGSVTVRFGDLSVERSFRKTVR